MTDSAQKPEPDFGLSLTWGTDCTNLNVRLAGIPFHLAIEVTELLVAIWKRETEAKNSPAPD